MLRYGRTDGHDEVNSLVCHFCECKCSCSHLSLGLTYKGDETVPVALYILYNKVLPDSST
jgi:hypothetical protein